MSNNNNEHFYIKANEVAEVMEISLSKAYKVINLLNSELKSQGGFVMAGRINREYFFMRLCAGTEKVGA